MQVQFSIERKHLIGAAIAALVIVAAVGWGLYFRSESAAAALRADVATIQPECPPPTLAQRHAITAETLTEIRKDCWHQCAGDFQLQQRTCANSCVEVTLYGSGVQH